MHMCCADGSTPVPGHACAPTGWEPSSRGTLCPTGPGQGAAGAGGVRGSDVLSGRSRGARPVRLRAAVGSLRLRAGAAEEGAPQYGQAGGRPAHKQGRAKLVPARGREDGIRCGCKPALPQGSPRGRGGCAGCGERGLGASQGSSVPPVSSSARPSLLPPSTQHITTTQGSLRWASSAQTRAPFPLRPEAGVPEGCRVPWGGAGQSLPPLSQLASCPRNSPPRGHCQPAHPHCLSAAPRPPPGLPTSVPLLEAPPPGASPLLRLLRFSAFRAHSSGRVPAPRGFP